MKEPAKLTGPAPGFVKYPSYRVDLAPTSKRVRVKVAGETIVDSTNGFLMLESNHSPVYYFPRADVRMDFLERTEHGSF